MACERFKELERQIRKECRIINATEKTTRYLINKASNLIRKANFDIYQVVVSMGNPVNLTGYTTHPKIEFVGGVMYLNIVVD
ncbi:hypothetical protein NVP1223O_22 [Vibrio phage 1.223.O._10N.261.48.A9]|nr:hypothetical protein NVP1223O_22 [Vibrio phage 1.223.O._10N.261.48.A9]